MQCNKYIILSTVIVLTSAAKAMHMQDYMYIDYNFNNNCDCLSKNPTCLHTN